MSDYSSSLRPPASPSGRASSPVGGMNPSRYSMNSLGKGHASMGAAGLGGSSHNVSSGGAGGGGGSMRSPSMGHANMPSTPRSGQQSHLRPTSELVGNQYRGMGGGGGGGGQGNNAESDAIDKWFEDLQHYEATLEEMAAASLDQNFKEELGAIEQWFRVLSEAERTAALYSLLQESTQVQIRFFITVLQQMARSDPMSALLSPGRTNSIMAEQMEAKLASLGLKAPTAAPPTSGGQSGSFRQSSDAAGFLSPNAAALYGMSNNGNNGDMHAMIAAQRAKLKANRISAPGTLPGDQAGMRNFSGGNLDQVRENRQQSDELGGRPRSIDGLSNASKSPRPSGPLDDQLSPISNTGNWASMSNTPLLPMFADETNNGNLSLASKLEAANAQLASVNDQAGRNVLLDQDVSKYRRKQGQSGAGLSSSPNASSSSSTLWGAPNQDFLRQAMAPTSSTSPLPGSASFNPQMSPNSLAGLQSPSGGLSNPLNMQMMNAMASMGGLNNVSAAQFLQMQQQLLSNQQQISSMASQGYQQQSQRIQQSPSPYNSMGRSERGAALQGLGASGIGGAGGRRSPANTRMPLPRGLGATGAGAHAGGAASAHGEEDVTDIDLLRDIPNWLRVLRLHKYTPNFEAMDWRDIVVMNDKALEDKGVAALGARRKMLKTFEQVREKHGIPHPPDSGEGEGAAAETSASNTSDSAGKTATSSDA